MLVALHAGTGYSSHGATSKRALPANNVASPDVDLVYGHHAHVVRNRGR